MPQFLRNIKIGVFISFVNLLIQGISFFVQNFVAQNLSTANFGYFGILQTDYSIFSAIADFGMTTLILAFFGDRATKGSLFRNVLQLRLFSSIMTALLMVTFAFTIRRHHPAFKGELILSLGLLFQHAFFDWYFICGKFWKRLFISKLLHTISYAVVMGVALLYLKLDKIEHIALAMLIAALPAFFFGVTQAFHARLFRITKRTFHFFYLMFKAGMPYAIASLASFAYLPVGLYVADAFSSPEFLSAYNFANKIIVLASGFMVHFISSSLINLHQSKDHFLHIKDQLLFTLFIFTASSPLWLFPKEVLQILFFAAPWNDSILAISADCLRILSFSLTFQALRMGLISSLLKDKKTKLYGLFVCIGGGSNIIFCTIAGAFLSNIAIPIFALSGDVVITFIIWSYFFKNRSIRW